MASRFRDMCSRIFVIIIVPTRSLSTSNGIAIDKQIPCSSKVVDLPNDVTCCALQALARTSGFPAAKGLPMLCRQRAREKRC